MWYHKFEQMLEGAHKMEKLSRMQQRVYDYIAESIAEHGYAPSVREVGEALGLKSPSTVHFHIKHLQEMGLIEKSAGKGRAITLKKQLQAVPVAPQPVEIDELAPRRRQVPILGNVAAGNPILAQECIEDYLTFDTGGHDDEYFALRVRGESMLGVGILPDDLVVVHRQNLAQNGQIVRLGQRIGTMLGYKSGELQSGAILFSKEYGFLCETEHAEDLLKTIREG